MSDERIKKLPKWVQSYIHVLECNLEDAQVAYEEAQELQTGITWNNLGDTFPAKHHPLPRHAHVHFSTSSGGQVTICRTEHGYVEVRNGKGHRLIVRPIAANVISVDIEQ